MISPSGTLTNKMADIMEEDLKKMKVPELKQALKDKGLSISGTKPDLIKRLVESMGASGDGSDPVLDEDEILKDDPAPVVAAVPANSTSSGQGEKETTSNGVLSVNPIAKSNVQMAADTTVTAKPTDVKTMTETERLKMRAEKFGISSEQAKKDLRAQRFGIPSDENKSGSISSSTGPFKVDVEKLKKRAERFGVSTSSVTEDEKKRKRAERFGISTTTSTKANISLNSTDSEIEAKKRKRAERFGLS